MIESASRWLVGSSSSSVVGAGEQDPGQLDPAALAAGERCSGWASTRSGSPRPAAIRAASASAAYPPGAGNSVSSRAYRRIAFSRGCVVLPMAIRFSVARSVVHDRVEAAGGQHPVAGEHVEVAGARVLRQVADLARPRHRAGGGLALAGEHLGERGLARAVAADQADPVARGDAERGAVEEEPRTGAQLDPRGHDHNRRFCQCRLRGPNRFPQSPVLSPTVTRAIEVRTVDAAQHLAFVEARSGSFLQTPAWGRLKTDWRAESLGWFRNTSTGDEMVGAGLVLYRSLPRIGRSLAYLPEGPVTDWDAPEALDVLRTLRDHVKSQGAFALRIGPPVPVRRWHADTVKAAMADDTVSTLRDVAPDVTEDAGMRLAASSSGSASSTSPPTTASPRGSPSTSSSSRWRGAPRRTCSRA